MFRLFFRVTEMLELDFKKLLIKKNDTLTNYSINLINLWIPTSMDLSLLINRSWISNKTWKRSKS
jgi:hypothetical protein